MKPRIYFFMMFWILALAACTAPVAPTQGPVGGETPEVVTPGAETPDTVTPEAETPTASPGAPAPEDPLANTQWTLESFGPVDTVEPVVEGTTVTLEFGEDGQAGGTGGCNSYGTTYEVNGNQISFGDITSTLILCEAAGVMDQEGSFFQALQEASQFELTGDRLQIEYGGGEGLLSFVRSSAQATGSPEPGTGVLCTETTSLSGSDWNLCRSATYGFEVGFSPEGELVDQSPQSARIDLPFTPGTNLIEKYLEITATETEETCSSPLAAGYEPGTIPTEMVQVNDLEFTRETGHEGAAGSIYEWVAYSIGKNGLCISLGFVLRSSNPDVFSTPPPLFDSAAESQIFEEIVGTFRWLSSP